MTLSGWPSFSRDREREEGEREHCVIQWHANAEL